MHNYKDISVQMKNMGFREFIDYIYYDFLYKKIVLLHGNCHMDVLELNFMKSQEFKRSYSIYPNETICNNSKKYISEDVLKNVDVFIHQDIKDDNQYAFELSDSYIRRFLKQDVVDITVPNLFGLGYITFPDCISNIRNEYLCNGNDRMGCFSRTYKKIDELIQIGASEDFIIEQLSREDLISENDVLDNFTFYMSKIKKREENWDIPISEFINRNYQSIKLFYDPTHPTNVILNEISRKVFCFWEYKRKSNMKRNIV